MNHNLLNSKLQGNVLSLLSLTIATGLYGNIGTSNSLECYNEPRDF